MADPLKETVPLLPSRFLLVGDGYDGSEALVVLCKDIDGDVWVRLAKNRVL